MSMTPPQNIEAEQALLGGVINDNHALAEAADVVEPADFYRADHRAIWNAVVQLDGANKPVDLVTVAEQLQGQGELLSYLGKLVQSTPSSANVRHYAAIVRDKALQRRLLKAAGEVHRMIAEGGEASEHLEAAQRAVMEIGAKGGSGPVLARELLPNWITRMQERESRGGELQGLSTGFPDLDRLTGGLCPGDLVILAARPSMGKTSFAMNIAEHAALRDDTPVAVFSMEMGADQLMDRMVSSMARVPLNLVRTAQMDNEQWSRAMAVTTNINRSSLVIDDTPSLSLHELRARARRVKQRHGCGLVVVDYLQLMQGSSRSGSRHEDVAEISRGLKALAKEMQVPVIALSQLNRSLEQRPNKRPVMSDLRESGQIEQDADLILFAYREEVYHDVEQGDPRFGMAEIIIGKQRNGELGKAIMTFLGQFTRFESAPYHEQKLYRDYTKPGEKKKGRNEFEAL